MPTYRIDGGRRLEGDVAVGGAKNAALPVLAAAGLAVQGDCVLHNVPRHSDILDLLAILEALGAEAGFTGPNTVTVRADRLTGSTVPYDLAVRMRASVYLAGVLLARLGRAEVGLPGGDDIGARPVDFHLSGLGALGARVGIVHGAVVGTRDVLKGAHVVVERQSVGTTCQLMIAAALAHGTTELENAAREPEVVDLATFLNAMGGRVHGAGTAHVRIEGVAELHGAEHDIMPDRIEAGTFLLAAGATAGRITVRKVIPEHLKALTTMLGSAGALVTVAPDAVTLDARSGLAAVDVRSEPYPGYPTDLQPQIVAALSTARGVSIVEETVFENRFGYVNDLIRLGARVRIVDPGTAVVTGVEALSGAPVSAQDIRAGAALVIAGLVAGGTTQVSGVHHILRGYECLDEKLRALGARIDLVQEDGSRSMDGRRPRSAVTS